MIEAGEDIWSVNINALFLGTSNPYSGCAVVEAIMYRS